MSTVSFGSGTAGFEGRMGRVEFGGGKGTMLRVNPPIPNPDMAEFLVSAEMETYVRTVTERIAAAYYNLAPESQFDENVPGSGEQNLKNHIGADVNIGGHEDHDRIYGYVYNDALSYRKTRGQPYPRFVEYGKPTKGKPGGHHLERAADLIAGGGRIVNYMPGMSYVEEGRGSKIRGGRGRFVADPMRPRKPKVRKVAQPDTTPAPATNKRAAAKKASNRKKKK